MKTALHELNSSAARVAIQEAMADPHVMALARSLNIDLNDEALRNSVVFQAELNLELSLAGPTDTSRAKVATTNPAGLPREAIRNCCVSEALHAYRAVAAI